MCFECVLNEMHCLKCLPDEDKWSVGRSPPEKRKKKETSSIWVQQIQIIYSEICRESAYLYKLYAVPK